MNPEGKLRVGIAGYGVIGAKRHAVCRDHPVLEVVAVCDRKFGGRRELPDGTRSHGERDALLAEDLDVLFVCLPNDVAPDATIAGLERGLHVFCEKPPGRTVADIKRVRAVEARHPGLKLKYGFNHRYHPSVLSAHGLVQSGELGRLINLRGVYGKSALIPWPRPDASDTEARRHPRHWRTSRSIAGGGILLDQGIHMVDLMLLFAEAKFRDIHAFVDNGYWGHDVEDNAYALMRTESGVVAMLHSSATLWRHRFTLDLSLTEGSIQLSGILSGTKSYGEERLTVIRREDETNGLPTEHTTTYVDDESWRGEIEDFVDCIIADRPVTVGDSAAALASMQTVHRIYRADSSWARRSRSAARVEAPRPTARS